MDNSVQKGYEEILRDIVKGARRSSPTWPVVFADVTGSFEERIVKAFEISGFIPSRTQFERERMSIIYGTATGAETVPVVEPVVEPTTETEPETQSVTTDVSEPTPGPKPSRKRSPAPQPVEAVEEPAVTEEENADENA